MPEKVAVTAAEQYFKKEPLDFSEMLEMTSISSRQIRIGDIDECSGDTLDMLVKFYNQLDDENNVPIDQREPIYLLINSNGGSTLSALTMIDVINASKTPVYTVNIGIALSAGFLIFINGHKRFAYPHSTFLFHEGSVGPFAGDMNKFHNFSDFTKDLTQTTKNIILAKTSISEEIYSKHEKDDWWISAAEAIEYNIADEITTELFPK